MRTRSKSLWRRRGIGPWLGLALLLASGSCDGRDPLEPFAPEIDNRTDSFQLQATDVRDVTTTLEYTWQNTGTRANVDHSTTTTGGTTRLIIRDGDGNPVYDKPLAASLNEQTITGAAGAWSIRLILANYRGTLNFRVQKP